MKSTDKKKTNKIPFILLFFLILIIGVGILVFLAIMALNNSKIEKYQSPLDRSIASSEAIILNQDEIDSNNLAADDTAASASSVASSEPVEELNPKITEQKEDTIDPLNQLKSETGKPIDPTNKTDQSDLDYLF